MILIFVPLLSNQMMATHVRGGELTYRRISQQSFSYQFTLTMYHDIHSPVRSGDGLIDFEDGRVIQIDLEAVSFEDGVFIGPYGEIELFTIKIEHTFNSAGTYTVSYTEPNRNDEIINFNLGNANMIPFRLESMLIIDPLIGVNSSPVFNTFPVDFGFVGKSFSHNPWAWDPDGDSLAYRLISPRTKVDAIVVDYLNPNNSEFYRTPLNWNFANEEGDGPASYSIDPFTGDLRWNSPGNLLINSQGNFSEYNLALLVEEWRKIEGSWRRIGFVTRDFLVIVTPESIGRPDFPLPEDHIIITSEQVNEAITFSDPDGDPIAVEFFGESFDLPNNPMTATPLPGEFTGGSVAITLQWTPLPEHVRDRPYYVHLKITDHPENEEHKPAVTYKTWTLSFFELPDVLTALPAEEWKNPLVLYPNPTSGILGWRLPGLASLQSLTIYNSMGQQTLYLKLSSNVVREIDISQFPSGLYYAELTADGNSYRKPFFKE